MYTAITAEGKMINLFTMENKDELKGLRELPIYCPECKGRVILKMGEKKITHFAHERTQWCAGNGEAESSYHLQGKLQLYQKLLEVNLEPKLEPYFPEIKQRADISFVFNKEQYVIEYQCAVISPQLVKKRTEGYRKINIYPIWIIGFHHLKKWNPIKVKLSTFIYQFFTFYQNQYLLPTYCPYDRVFYLIQNPVPISISQTFISTSSYPLVKMEGELKLPILSNKNFSISYWRELIHRQKTKDVHYPTKTNDHFLKELYARELHPHFLPPFIGIPLKEGFLIETPPLYWQATIFLDSFFDATKIYPLQKVYGHFQRRIEKGNIKIRDLPFLKEKNWKVAVKQYLQTLINLKIMEEIKPNFYRLLYWKEIRNYKVQTQEEMAFYKHLKKLNDMQ
ncbi:competence protein CoiA family protein [Niallia alba]|uniref:competence protein CoiA n=1 Tax=Niallia alba TaxID=2729105 RepID=UPI002E1F64A2|nr:competence protein CoiA family protein [Niallia alba]